MEIQRKPKSLISQSREQWIFEWWTIHSAYLSHSTQINKKKQVKAKTWKQENEWFQKENERGSFSFEKAKDRKMPKAMSNSLGPWNVVKIRRRYDFKCNKILNSQRQWSFILSFLNMRYWLVFRNISFVFLFLEPICLVDHSLLLKIGPQCDYLAHGRQNDDWDLEQSDVSDFFVQLLILLLVPSKQMSRSSFG